MSKHQNETPNYETIETLCSKKRRTVKLTLDITDRKGDYIKGIPVSCATRPTCSMGPLCLLNADYIQTMKGP